MPKHDDLVKTFDNIDKCAAFDDDTPIDDLIAQLEQIRSMAQAAILTETGDKPGCLRCAA